MSSGTGHFHANSPATKSISFDIVEPVAGSSRGWGKRPCHTIDTETARAEGLREAAELLGVKPEALIDRIIQEAKGSKELESMLSGARPGPLGFAPTPHQADKAKDDGAHVLVTPPRSPTDSWPGSPTYRNRHGDLPPIPFAALEALDSPACGPSQSPTTPFFDLNTPLCPEPRPIVPEPQTRWGRLVARTQKRLRSEPHPFAASSCDGPMRAKRLAQLGLCLVGLGVGLLALGAGIPAWCGTTAVAAIFGAACAVLCLWAWPWVARIFSARHDGIMPLATAVEQQCQAGKRLIDAAKLHGDVLLHELDRRGVVPKDRPMRFDEVASQIKEELEHHIEAQQKRLGRTHDMQERLQRARQQVHDVHQAHDLAEAQQAERVSASVRNSRHGSPVRNMSRAGSAVSLSMLDDVWSAGRLGLDHGTLAVRAVYLYFLTRQAEHFAAAIKKEVEAQRHGLEELNSDLDRLRIKNENRLREAANWRRVVDLLASPEFLGIEGSEDELSPA